MEETNVNQAAPAVQSAPQLVVFLVLGAPGSGKGTICSEISADFEYEHISVGDYLRELCTERANVAVLEAADITQDELKQYLEARQLLPGHIIVPMLKYIFDQVSARGVTGVVLDGFPRDLATAELFEDVMPQYRPQAVFMFQCDHDTAEERFIRRARSIDDGYSVFAHRYREFVRNNPAVLQHYENRLVIVDTSGSEQDNISNFWTAYLSFVGLDRDPDLREERQGDRPGGPMVNGIH